MLLFIRVRDSKETCVLISLVSCARASPSVYAQLTVISVHQKFDSDAVLSFFLNCASAEFIHYLLRVLCFLELRKKVFFRISWEIPLLLLHFSFFLVHSSFNNI